MSELPKETPINPGISSVTSREQGGSSVTEQTMPHSGGRNVPEQLREQPVREFDNTSLGEALDQGYLEVPTSPSPIPEAQPAVTAPEKKKRNKLLIGASAGLAGVAIVAASVIGINAANSNTSGEDPEGPKADPKGTTEVTPEPKPVETEKSFEQQVNELKIEAGLSPEEYVDTLIAKRMVDWEFAGKEQYWKVAGDGSNSVDDINTARKAIVAEQNRVFANALFIPGWENTELASIAERRKINQEATLDTWGRTKANIEFAGDTREEWQTGMVIERVELLEENPDTGTRKFFIAGYETNNGDRAAYQSVNAKNNGAPWSFTFTTQVVDGTEYIAEWSNTESPAH
ncbi:hypothetical protein KI440_00120 [Candidatus Saccharibacteria bacterium TM7i]|nr:hypothetical protein KI440_00120 [Candidatus Saccharibacteria bacterium TM7i]